MGDKYFELARSYIAQHPQDQQNLENLAFQLKIMGIPPDKIQPIMTKLAHETASFSLSSQSKTVSGRSYTKPLLLLYFAVMFVMLYLIFFVFNTPKTKNISYIVSPPAIEDQKVLPSTPSGGIVRPVYAKDLPIQMERVFSYPPKNISVAPSIRPKREVVGFIPYWALNSLDNLQINQITTASLFGLEADGEGNIIVTDTHSRTEGGWNMWNDQRLGPFIDKLKKSQVNVTLTIKMFSNYRMEQMLKSEDAQKKLISNIMYMVSSKNLDGVNLDFEYVGTPPASMQGDFTKFVNTLNFELKREFPKATLMIDTYASSGLGGDMFDLPALAKVSDAFVIMGYDFHTPYSAPGPVAPLTGEQSIVGYLANYLQRVPADKIILGVPYYGYDWVINNPSPSSTNTLSYADIVNTSGNNIQWDSLSQTPWYQYTDQGGNVRKVHFENVRSLGLKYDVVNERQLKGIGIWAVGYEGLNNELESLISQKFGY